MAQLFLDIEHNAVTGTSIVPFAQTTTVTGSAVDLSSAVGNMASAVLEVGAVSGTQGSYAVQVQSSTATDTGWTNVPTGGAFDAVTTSGLTTGGAFYIKSFQVPARYVRAIATASGTFTSMLLGVHFFAQRSANPDNSGGWSNAAAGV